MVPSTLSFVLRTNMDLRPLRRSISFQTLIFPIYLISSSIALIHSSRKGPFRSFLTLINLTTVSSYIWVCSSSSPSIVYRHSLPLGARSQLFPVEIRSPMVPMSTGSSRVKYGTFSSAQSESSGRRTNSSFVVSSPHSKAQVSTQIDLVSHIEISSNNVTVLWKFDSNSVTHPLLCSPTNTYLFEVSD